jgi:hypothetical protein
MPKWRDLPDETHTFEVRLGAPQINANFQGKSPRSHVLQVLLGAERRISRDVSSEIAMRK